MRILSTAIVRVAAFLLPASLRDWGVAMRGEIDAIEGDGPALQFALGCLGSALGEAAFAHFILPLRLPLGPLSSEGDPTVPIDAHLFRSPRRLAAICAAGTTGLGLAYMAAGGAPTRYLAINAAALILGFALAAAALAGARSGRVEPGPINLALGLALLLTSLFGVTVDGATRWISIGGLSIQPSLILLPALAVSFARGRDALSAAGVVVAALALAIQPDRAMAGALAAGMAALAIARPERSTLATLAGAVIGLTVTLARPDVEPAMPFVDQIFYSSFDVHLLAGLAVLAGALLMIAPAVVGWIRDVDHRDLYLTFGAVWLATIIAAALGNYPTPLVGYGGSAIIGYVLSLIGLPRGIDAAISGTSGSTAPEVGQADMPHGFRAGLPYIA